MYNLYYLKSNLDDKFYIGITKYPSNRYKAHLRYSIKESHYNGNWIRKTLQNGGEIEMNIILSNLNKETAILLEKTMISLLKRLGVKITNTADGGLGFNHKGIPHSEEHKKAIERGQPHKVRIPKEVMYDLYVNKKLSKKKIAKLYNCGMTTIDRRLKEYNIQPRTTPNYKVSYKLDKKDILDLYLNKKITLSKIAKKYNIGVSGIRLILEKENIKTGLNKITNRVYKRKYDPNIILKIKEMSMQGKTIREICDELNLNKNKVSYIKFRYLKSYKFLIKI